MATDPADGQGRGGLRLPGWRGLLIVWTAVVLAVASVALWAEWRQNPLRQVVTAATGEHEPAPGIAPPVPEAASEATVAPESVPTPTGVAEASASVAPPAGAEPPPVPDPPAAPALRADLTPSVTSPEPEPEPGPKPQAEAIATPAAPVAPPIVGAEPPAVAAPGLAVAPPAFVAPTAPPAPEPAPGPAPVPAAGVAGAPASPVAPAPRPVTLAPAATPVPAAPAPLSFGNAVATVPAPEASPPSLSGAVAATLPPGLQMPAAVAAARQVPVAPTPAPAGSAIPAPDLALLEASVHGFLPRRGADGRLPWQYYAQPFRRADNRARVAIIVSDSGMAFSMTEEAIRRLPVQIAFAISPYASQPALIAARARERGMETLIAVPMEPSGFPLNDPGIRPLLTMSSAAQNAENLDWVLSRFSGYVGAVGALGSMRGERFATMPDMMRRVHDSLRERGLLYIDPRPGTPTTERVWGRTVDVILDEPPTRAEVERRLADLDVAARLRGSALGYAGTLTPGLVDRLLTWSSGLEARGLVLAPVSAILRVRTPMEPVPSAEPASATR